MHDAFDPRIPKLVFQTINKFATRKLNLQTGNGFFSHFCFSDQKTSLGTWCSFDPKIQIKVSEIGNGIFQTGNGIF